MKKPPCIRGLTPFKKGCPEKSWDGEGGCPAWVELLTTPLGEPTKPKKMIGKCIDRWQIDLTITQLGLLEGNQQAVESFRNNMTVDGSPKPDPAVVKLLKVVIDQKRLREDYKQKTIRHIEP